MAKKTDDIVEEAKQTTYKTNKMIRFIPTSSDISDLILGGGHGWGKIVNIIGDKSTGKTLLTLEGLYKVKNQLKDKVSIIYDDCESGFSFDIEDMYGEKDFVTALDPPSDSVEDFNHNLQTQMKSLKKDKYLIYIVDSLDGLTSKAEQQRDVERTKAMEAGKPYVKGTYGQEKQKFMSEFFRLRTKDIKDKNVLLIVISQVRGNIGVTFGNKFSRSGGKALDFYAGQIYWLAEADKMIKKANDVPIGIRTKLRCSKNKLGKPFRFGFIDILFDYGVDNVSTNINYLYNLLTPPGKLERSNTRKVEWDGQEYTLRALVKHIESNDLEKELTKRVKDKWQQAEDDRAPRKRKM